MERTELLKTQLDLTWRFAREALDGLTGDEELWVPSHDSWTVRQGDDGRWVPDWEEPEPSPPPSASIGWVQWHVIWWWSTVIDRSFRGDEIQRRDVTWPGPSRSMEAIDRLRREWLGYLDGLSEDDLSSGTLTRWPYTDDRPFLFVAGWVNMELMKNVAEMALIRRVTPFYVQSG
jgi:DinB superfamily